MNWRKVVIFVFLAFSSLCMAQSVTPPVPTTINLPSPTISSSEPVELTTHETVSLATGGVGFSLPVVSLPQRDGSALKLGFILDGNTFTLREPHNMFTSNSRSQGELVPYQTFVQNAPSLNTMLWGQIIHTNLPTLTADLSYAGLDAYDTCNPPEGQCAEPGINGWQNWPEYCMQNWTFTDWDGSSHPFNGTRDCSEVVTLNSAPTGDGYWIFNEQLPLKLQTSQSVDDAYYMLDATNTADIRITKRDGTVYHFGGYPSTGYVGTFSRQNSPSSDFTFLNRYSAFFSSIVDPNGNTITYANSVITDTVGRSINVTSSSIGYTAMNGQSTKPVTATVTQQAASGTVAWPVSYPPPQNGLSGPCKLNYVGSQGEGISQPILTYNGPEGGTLAAPNTYTITLQNESVYTLTFDVTGNVIKITYPSGGYTKYDYLYGSSAGIYQNQDFGDLTCKPVSDQLLAKHECSLASGSCAPAPVVTIPGSCTAGWPASGEATTCYSGLYGALQPGGISTENGGTEAFVTDPYGNRSTHITNGNFTYSYGGSFSTSVTYHVGYFNAGEGFYNGQSTLIKSVIPSFANSATGCLTGIHPWNLQPCSVTTTYSDISPAISSVVNYSYDSTGFPNITQIKTSDFSGNLLETKNAVWYHGGIYQASTAGSTSLGNILDHLSSMTSVDATSGNSKTTALTYDSRGNLLQSTTSATGVAALSTTYTPLDTYGRPTQTKDPKGNITTYGFADSWYEATCAPSSNSQAYLTSVTNALNQTTYFKYDSCTGELGSVKDPNGNITTFAYDGLGRTVGVTYPDGGSKTNSYVDTAPESIETTTVATPDPAESTKAVFDGFSRPTQTQVLSDPAAVDYVDTTYDALGRVATTSNPYRSTTDSTYGLSTYAYDALGRKTSLTHSFDGSSQQWSYSGNQTNSTDETGRIWSRTTDALGRLTKVLEPDGSANIGISPTLETDYQYDGFSNLIRVDQWGGPKGSSNPGDRVRLFQYDAISRLLKTCNPETITSGSTCSNAGPWGETYAYDPDGNVITKTDGRGITVNYGYDALNRLTGKTYTVPNPAPADYAGTPAVVYYYDQTAFNGLTILNGVGRRTGMTDGAGQSSWTYDKMGRVQQINRTTNGLTKFTTNTYDAAGLLTNILYYTGTNVAYVNDGAGHAISAIDPTPITFVKNVTYNPAGEITGMVSGAAGSYTGLTLGSHYDGRLRLTQSSANTTGSTLQSLSYTYDAASNINQITNNVTTAHTQMFHYDNMNRITSGQAGTLWGNTYQYDQFGNLSQINPIPGVTPAQTLTLAPTVNNQLAGGRVAYDAAGNMSSDNLGTAYYYDAENRIAKVGLTTYIYDGEGNRAIKTGGTANRMYWYGIGGEVLNEFDTSGNNSVRNVYLGGALRARRYASGSIDYIAGDQIGSARVVVNSSGGVEDNTDYVPFGATASYSTSTSGDVYKFTGKERDAESGVDYFGARYYGSGMGRFTSADWAVGAIPVPYAKLDSPQSLNLYIYVLNNPLRQPDPDGHVGLPGNSGSPQTCANGAGSSSCNPQSPPPAQSAQKSNTAASSISPAGRIALGVVGLANLWDAFQRADFTVAASVALFESPPAATAVALYGTVSVVGQGTAGAAQIAQAVTGTNAAKPIEQAGNILAGPISGNVTLLLGGSQEKAEENANWESFATGGAGLVNHRESMITRIVEFTLGLLGVNPH